jgi:hypothetical protein
VLEPLGPDDSEIQFSGTFSGPEAEARVRALNDLRLSGQVVWLTWESFRYQVVVKTFLADYHSPWWISYRISCIVAYQPGATISLSSALEALVTADLGNALAAVGGTSIQLAPLSAALSMTNSLIAGTSDQSQAANTVASSLGIINQEIAVQSAALVAPFGTTDTASDYGMALQNTVASAGVLAAAINAGSYIGRIGANLNSLGG